MFCILNRVENGNPIKSGKLKKTYLGCCENDPQ